MTLHIEPSSPDPIYRQIVGQITRLISAGQWVPGTRLPSVREVAAAHAVNPMTVSKAYALLESQGLLERQRGKGMVVAAPTRRRAPCTAACKHCSRRCWSWRARPASWTWTPIK
ncbi:GntR family transcriptional regulator [Pseudomonas brassicae]|uniref:GntR family transcriptional regulator n=1 Tax=Pseudomonas brassicae TaxID=2708063 RepID=UPI001FB5046F|nr:GntR family transcriptional regulator [Pseudomonas brassicae]